MLEERARARPLDDPAGVHDRDHVRVLCDDTEIVGDEDHRGALLRPQLGKQVEYLILDRDVEVRRRLVGEDQPGPARDRDRDHRALAHAARQLVRIGAEARAGRRNPDALEQSQGLGACLGARDVEVGPDGLGDLVADGEHGVQRTRRILEDHGDDAAAEATKRTL